MVFSSKEMSTIRENRYSMYHGPAEICTIEIKPDGGHWREKPRGWMSLQEQAKGQGKLPRLWYADLPESPLPLPTKFIIKTDYGAMVMHLKELSVAAE